MLKKFYRNQPFHPRAADLNAMVDSARALRAGRHAERFDKSPGFRQASIFPVRNDSGDDRAAFDIVGIDGPLHGPSGTGSNLVDFQRRLALLGAAPTDAHFGKIGILLTGVSEDEFGKALLLGVSPVQVQIDHTAHQFADVLDGNAAKLKSGVMGCCQILWRENAEATGTQWCVVRLGNVSAEGEVKALTDEEIVVDGSGTVSVWLAGSDSGINVTAHLNWMHGGENVSSGKQVLIRWFADEQKWIIVQAECE